MKHMKVKYPNEYTGCAIYLWPIYLLNQMKMRKFFFLFCQCTFYSVHGNYYKSIMKNNIL